VTEPLHLAKEGIVGIRASDLAASAKRKRRTNEVRTSQAKLAKKLGCPDFSKAPYQAETWHQSTSRVGLGNKSEESRLQPDLQPNNVRPLGLTPKAILTVIVGG
jgi:hypothetical protein